MQGNTTTHVILCRHGESQGNLERRFGGHGATPLTERGREQARCTGRCLASERIDVVYSSDLGRAIETAALICREIGANSHESTALRERSVGELTGLTFDEARERYPEAYAALLRREPNACPPGGESYAQCRVRVAAFLAHALSRHAGSRILLVSHNLTLHQLIFHILGIELGAFPPQLSLQIDHCALHRFEHQDDGTWRVIALNDRGHLSSLVEPLP
jgi:probable phosphoglycerate mutase